MLHNRRIFSVSSINKGLDRRPKVAQSEKVSSVLTSGKAAFDYIVIGAGSAGCALVNRLLSGLPDATVCLIDAGGINTAPEIQDFTRAMSLYGTKYDWNDKSIPQTQLNNRPMSYNSGKVFGGSSSINGVIWARGNAGDYERWAQLGNSGWDYQSLLPVFKRQEVFDGGDPQYRGVDGPMCITSAITQHSRIANDFVQSAVEMGYALNTDYNAASQWGVAFSQLNVKPNNPPISGIRQDSFTTFVSPHLSNQQLTIVDQAQVTKITFDSTKTVSQVWVQIDNQSIPIRPLQEVILCTGSLRSPQILMLSGIGDPSTLQSLAIPVLAPVSGVGQNLQDHMITFIVRQLAKTEPDHYWPMCNNIFTHGLPGSGDGAGLPTFQVQTFHMLNNPGFAPHSYAIGAIALQPLSRGHITLSSANYLDAPIIQPNLLSEPEDRAVLLSGLKMVREIGVQFANRFPWLGAEYMPGPDVTTDADLTAYIQQTAVSDFHFVGTCKMGPDTDEGAVVDPQLRVRGITGLRVADASIMPFVPSANTNAAAVMVGGRCGDFIVAEKA